MNIGAKIRKIRKERGFTQIELAKKAEMAVNSIRLYESGNRTPSIEQRVKIAEVLDYSAYDFMTNEEIESFKVASELGYWAREEEMRSLIYEFSDVPPGSNISSKQMQAIISWAKDNRKGRLMTAYDQLNDTGQRIAVEQVEALTKQPELQRTDVTEQMNTTKPTT